MESWPSYAIIIYDGYDETPDFHVLRTETDSGIAIQRARRNLAIHTRNITVLIRSNADKASFDSWVKDDIHKGVDWFMLTAPVTGHSIVARIISGAYKWTNQGAEVWRANMQIESLGE